MDTQTQVLKERRREFAREVAKRGWNLDNLSNRRVIGTQAKQRGLYAESTYVLDAGGGIVSYIRDLGLQELEASSFPELPASKLTPLQGHRKAATLQATTAIQDLMEEMGVTPGEMAKRMGVSSACVSKMLRGHNNFTLHTLSDIFFHLGARFRIQTKAPTDD